MKKKYQAMILALGAVAAAGVGGSLAAGSAESPKITKTISEKTLGVTENTKIQTDVKVNPGDATESWDTPYKMMEEYTVPGEAMIYIPE